MKIKFITTGGTIDKVYFDARSEFTVGESQIPEMLRESNAAIEYAVVNVLQKDSLDLTDEDRATIRDAVVNSPESRIIVTHGTDTMIDTGKALAGVPGKVIVLTGSLSPARFKSSDAVFNVGTAVAAVQVLPEGVYIAMNGRILSPGRARKNREKNRFEETDVRSARGPSS